jgi:zinc protease
LARIDSRADTLGEYATLLGDPHLINTRLGEVHAVERDQISSASQDWFGVDRRATLIYRKDQR